ncbi:hypothetical protein Tco_0491214 [Tanacetum coccineum]
MLQELCSVIVGGALIHNNREGRKHEGRRIHPTIGDFGGNCASNQSLFYNGRIEEWEEKKKQNRVPTTKIFCLKILINNSRKFIEDKVRREKVFEVDEALDIDNLKARGIHVDEIKGFDYVFVDVDRPEEQHLVVPCSDEVIVKFSTQPAITKISGEDGINLEEFSNVLTMEEADITRPIVAVEDEPLMMLGSGPNIIKEDFSKDLDGQHSADESKPYHNTLRWQIMRLKWGYVISIVQISMNVWLKQEMVCVQRRTWDPGITWLKILKEHIEDKVFLRGGVMIRS